MQVLWLSHVVPYPPRAGVLLRAYHLLSSVAEHHDVDLVAFIQRPMLATFFEDFDAGLAECHAKLALRCRSVRFLPIERAERPLGKFRTAAEGLFSRYGYTACWLDSPAASTALRSIIAEQRYDVAHLDYIGLASYRSLLAEIPATLGHHNAESSMMIRRANHELNMLRKLYFRVEGTRLAHYERRVANWFQLHITCSDLDSERLRETMPTAKLLAVPNGVDTSFFVPSGMPQTPSSMIFVGTMNWYPNIDAMMFFLRDVWPHLRARIADATLDIVGAGAPAALKELAARSPGVTLHGYVPEIRPMIERAAIYICPIRDGGGTKLKVLDALAMGKCILAHPVACEGINVTPGLNVVFAKSPVDFIAKATALFSDSDQRRAIGSAARQLAQENYSFPTLGKQFTEALTKAADETLQQ